jgi:hypothetical protein
MSRNVATHEDFFREEEVRSSSDRTFGVVFTLFFLLVGLKPLMSHHDPRAWALALAGAFLLVSVARPRLLAPLNRLWLKLGLLLHRAINPIVMGMLFFAMVTPLGLILRFLGKDPLRLRPDPDAKGYWIERTPPGPAPESMKNQF